MEDIQKIIPAIVKIYTSIGTGTGFYVKKFDVIVTNFHVVAEHHSVAIQTQNKKKYVADVLMVDPDLDIAILKAQDFVEEMPELHLGDDTNEISNMARVSVLGFPFGMPFTVTEGIISSVDQILENKKYIQTDAAVNPGNSGGPLVDAMGNIIGLTTSKFTNADNIGFALPIQHVRELLECYEKEDVHSYSVKCISCSSLLTEPEEYCPSCGVEVDVKGLFAQRTLTPLGDFVEESLKKFGINPVIARNGHDSWEFHNGSALIRAFAYDNNHLYVVSPLVDLPKKNLQELYQYLLSNSVEPYYLSVHESSILLSYRIYLLDLYNEEYAASVQENIAHLIKKADELDNLLVEKFECVPAHHSNFS